MSGFLDSGYSSNPSTTNNNLLINKPGTKEPHKPNQGFNDEKYGFELNYYHLFTFTKINIHKINNKYLATFSLLRVPAFILFVKIKIVNFKTLKIQPKPPNQTSALNISINIFGTISAGDNGTDVSTLFKIYYSTQKRRILFP